MERFFRPSDLGSVDACGDADHAKRKIVDVCLQTTDGRHLIIPRYTQPESDQAILLHKLHLRLPLQPPPRIKAKSNEFPEKHSGCSADFFDSLVEKQALTSWRQPLLRKSG